MKNMLDGFFSSGFKVFSIHHYPKEGHSPGWALVVEKTLRNPEKNRNLIRNKRNLRPESHAPP